MIYNWNYLYRNDQAKYQLYLLLTFDLCPYIYENKKNILFLLSVYLLIGISLDFPHKAQDTVTRFLLYIEEHDLEQNDGLSSLQNLAGFKNKVPQ